MATRFAGRHQAAEYYLCPLGVHEGNERGYDGVRLKTGVGRSDT